MENPPPCVKSAQCWRKGTSRVTMRIVYYDVRVGIDAFGDPEACECVLRL